LYFFLVFLFFLFVFFCSSLDAAAFKWLIFCLRLVGDEQQKRRRKKEQEGRKREQEEGGKGKKPQEPTCNCNPSLKKPSEVLAAAEEETEFVPGLGPMTTKAWAAAYQQENTAKMIEIAETLKKKYWNLVDDQGKASLMQMLGVALRGGSELLELMSQDYSQQASNFNSDCHCGKVRKDLLMGVWPETHMLYGSMWGEGDPLGPYWKKRWDIVEKTLQKTRGWIDEEMTHPSDPELEKHIQDISTKHFALEMRFLVTIVRWFTTAQGKNSRAEIFADKALKRYGEIAKRDQSKVVVSLYVELLTETATYLIKLNEPEDEEKAEMYINMALQIDPTNAEAHKHRAQALFDKGAYEEGLKSAEILFSSLRKSDKRYQANHYSKAFEMMVNYKGESLREMDGVGPNTLWALKVGGFQLTPEQSALIKANSGVKQNVRCLNCDVQLAKVYKCSRCNMATYCGMECQKESWKSGNEWISPHKEVCNPEYKDGRNMLKDKAYQEFWNRKRPDILTKLK
jgi:tetratricopeptide (TPR) repeat protein